MENKGSLGLSAEAGPGWEGYVSVGIKGSGNVTANSVIPISKDDTSFSMQADLSVVGSLAGIRGSWKLISSPEMVFWDAGEWRSGLQTLKGAALLIKAVYITVF